VDRCPYARTDAPAEPAEHGAPENRKVLGPVSIQACGNPDTGPDKQTEKCPATGVRAAPRNSGHIRRIDRPWSAMNH